MGEVTLTNKKKMIKTMFIAFFIMVLLIGRLGFIQFFEGQRLQVLAYEQQVQQRADLL